MILKTVSAARQSGISLVYWNTICRRCLLSNLQMDTDKMKKKKFIFFYDYGTGGVWYYIYAYSKEAIEKVFPEMYVFEKPPKRFSLRDAQCIEDNPELFIFDIDNLHGSLKDYRENRQKNNYIYQHPDEKGPFVDDP